MILVESQISFYLPNDPNASKEQIFKNPVPFGINDELKEKNPE